MRHGKKNPWRFVYWFREPPDRLRALVRSAGYKCVFMRDLPCAAFRRDMPVIVVPGAWNKTCARQGSWYRASDKNGAVLLVSPVCLDPIFENKAVNGFLAATLDPDGFVPPRFARPGEVEALVSDASFLDNAPQEWLRASRRQSEFHMSLAKRFGAATTSWKKLFAIQSANHANFISPKLTAEINGEAVPYSIYPTAYLCSCCIQVFRVMETGREQLLAAPCPGGVIYGRLTPDRFVRVINHAQPDNARDGAASFPGTFFSLQSNR